MSHSDQLTTARITRTNAEFRNGVLTYVPKRPTVDAPTDIAEHLDAIEAKRERAIATARALKARDRARLAHTSATTVSRPATRPVTRVQMVTDDRRYVASQGRIAHVGAHTAGKHKANLDAGMVNAPLHVIARKRAEALGIA